MIQVRYRCRTGNRLFQYCFGRLLAEELGYALRARPVDGFPSTASPVRGDCFQTPVRFVSELFKSPDGSLRTIPDGLGEATQIGRVDVGRLVSRRPPSRLVVDGFFEYFGYFARHAAAIRERWVIPDPGVPVPERHPDDLVVHVRRGDVVDLGQAAPWSCFRRLLEVVDYRRLYLVSDFPGDPFFEHFKPYGATMLSTGISDHGRPHRVVEDFKSLMAFRKIALSSGTFGWWAGLLATDSQVFVPALDEFGVKRGGLSGRALWVPERRYCYVGSRAVYGFDDGVLTAIG